MKLWIWLRLPRGLKHRVWQRLSPSDRSWYAMQDVEYICAKRGL